MSDVASAFARQISCGSIAVAVAHDKPNAVISGSAMLASK